jgi:hypothetical protein
MFVRSSFNAVVVDGTCVDDDVGARCRRAVAHVQRHVTQASYARTGTRQRMRVLTLTHKAVWNETNDYVFDVRLPDALVFLQHNDIRLLQALSDDWAKTTQLTPEPELASFVPVRDSRSRSHLVTTERVQTIYLFNIQMARYRIHMNNSEMNVVGLFNDLDDNAHMRLRCARCRRSSSQTGIFLSQWSGDDCVVCAAV